MVRKKKRLRVAKKIPLTSEKQLENSKAEQARINKRRGNAMEHRIAKFIRGRRTPMSGASKGYKGDVEFELHQHPGRFIIECKLSAGINKLNDNTITLQHKWFQKLYDDTLAMGAKFGVLIIHFHLTKADYVFIRSEDIQHLFIDRYHSQYTDTLQRMLDLPITLDIRSNKHGRIIQAYALSRSVLESHIVSINGIHVAHIQTPIGTYIIIPLANFRDLIEDL